MRHPAAIASLALASMLVFSAKSPAQQSEWFDDNLSNWVGLKEYWKYKEGVLIASAPNGVKLPNYNKVGFKSTYLVSKKTYADFELAFKIRHDKRAIGDGLGLCVRSFLVDNVNFIVSGPRVEYDTNMFGSITGRLPAGGMFFKRVQMSQPLLGFDQRDFADYEIKVVGNRITVVFNGIKTVDEVFAQMPRYGYIGWQLTGNLPSEYMVRDIRFRDLNKNAKVASKPKVKEPAQPAPARFSADAAELFKTMSGPYRIDQRDVPASADMAPAKRLAKSSDAAVGELAKMSLELYALQEMRTAQGRKTLDALQLQAEIGAPLAFVKRIASGQKNATVGELVNDLMGDKVQDEFNKGYLLTYLGMDQSARLRNKIQALGEAKKIDLAGKAPLAIYCETTPPAALGSITFKNQSGRTLRHVLALANVVVDAERARQAGESEDGIGKFVLPALGLSPKAVAGSREAGKLRALAAQIDPGSVIFVPELPPNASVRMPVAHPYTFLGAKTVELSVFSDEVTVIRQRPSNLFEAQVTIKYPPHRNPYLK